MLVKEVISKMPWFNEVKISCSSFVVRENGELYFYDPMTQCHYTNDH